MIVEPDFLDHWKTKVLERRLGSMAPLLLIRLWSHCHHRRTSRFAEMSDEMLAGVCRWDGPADELRKALMEIGWIEEEADDGFSWTVVHDWEETNATLARNWRNGAKGGRPKKTQEKPKGNPDTNRANPELTDWKGLDGIGGDGKGLDGSSPFIPQGSSEGAEPSSESDRSSSSDRSTSRAPKISAVARGEVEAMLLRCFQREPGARWSRAEERGLEASGLLELSAEKFAEQAQLVEAFYRAEVPRDLKWVRRTTVKALLQNWAEMVDKARAWDREQVKDGVVMQ